MSASSAFVFETGIGCIGIAWSGRGLTHLQLPERDRAATLRRLLTKAGLPADAVVNQTELPPSIQALTDLLRRYAGGEAVDFSGVPLDLEGVDNFRLAIYGEARKLGFGETATYGDLARRSGYDKLFRETGQAMGSNPVPIVVPCHRVLAAGGRLGGFSAPGGSATKEKLLAMEGVSLAPPPPAQQSFGF